MKKQSLQQLKLGAALLADLCSGRYDTITADAVIVDIIRKHRVSPRAAYTALHTLMPAVAKQAQWHMPEIEQRYADGDYREDR